jgi:hypothetical protein
MLSNNLIPRTLPWAGMTWHLWRKRNLSCTRHAWSEACLAGRLSGGAATFPLGYPNQDSASAAKSEKL